MYPNSDPNAKALTNALADEIAEFQYRLKHPDEGPSASTGVLDLLDSIPMPPAVKPQVFIPSMSPSPSRSPTRSPIKSPIATKLEARVDSLQDAALERIAKLEATLAMARRGLDLKCTPETKALLQSKIDAIQETKSPTLAPTANIDPCLSTSGRE